MEPVSEKIMPQPIFEDETNHKSSRFNPFRIELIYRGERSQIVL